MMIKLFLKSDKTLCDKTLLIFFAIVHKNCCRFVQTNHFSKMSFTGSAVSAKTMWNTSSKYFILEIFLILHFSSLLGDKRSVRSGL